MFRLCFVFFVVGFFFVEAGGSVGKSIPVKIFVRL